MLIIISIIFRSLETELNNQSFLKPIAATSQLVTSKSEGTNKKVTEFFAVRRSVRKTKKEVQEERSRQIERCIREECEDGLAVRNF